MKNPKNVGSHGEERGWQKRSMTTPCFHSLPFVTYVKCNGTPRVFSRESQWVTRLVVVALVKGRG